MVFFVLRNGDGTVRLAVPRHGAEPLTIRRKLIKESPFVSRKHATVIESSDGASVLLSDLSSSNGTFVNNMRVMDATLARRAKMQGLEEHVVDVGNSWTPLYSIDPHW